MAAVFSEWRSRAKRASRAIAWWSPSTPEALLELATSPYAGIHNVAGADAVSRYELGVLIAQRDGLDSAALPTAVRAGSGLAGPVDVRLDCTSTQARLATRLRGAREFLAPARETAG